MLSIIEVILANCLLWNAFVVQGLTPLEAYNPIFGTQTIGPLYGFTSEDRLVESAKVILGTGSNILKIIVGRNMESSYGLPAAKYSNLTRQAMDSVPLKTVLDMPFAHYFLWTYPFVEVKWRDGLSDEERKREYNEMFEFTTYLLKTFNGSRKRFLLGHWEGDWYLLGNYNKSANPEPIAIQGMIDWLNTRQKAIDDAKAKFKHNDVFVWHYTEANLVRKAIEGKPSIALSVLPKVNVDYVSYSSYESLDGTKMHIQLPETLNFLKSKLIPKANLPGSRVLLGEFGFPLEGSIKTAQQQDELARRAVKIALQWGVEYALWWEVYDNSYSDPETKTKFRGFWLIDNKNVKQPLYFTLQSFNQKTKKWVSDFFALQKRYPNADEFRKHAVTFL